MGVVKSVFCIVHCIVHCIEVLPYSLSYRECILKTEHPGSSTVQIGKSHHANSSQPDFIYLTKASDKTVRIVWPQSTVQLLLDLRSTAGWSHWNKREDLSYTRSSGSVWMRLSPFFTVFQNPVTDGKPKLEERLWESDTPKEKSSCVVANSVPDTVSHV